MAGRCVRQSGQLRRAARGGKEGQDAQACGVFGTGKVRAPSQLRDP